MEKLDKKIAKKILEGIFKKYNMPLSLKEYDLSSRDMHNGMSGLFIQMLHYSPKSVGEFNERYDAKMGYTPKGPRWCRDNGMLS